MAQGVVKISPEASRWFLEQADKAEMLAKKDSLNNEIIDNLTATINTKDLLVESLRSREKSLNQIIVIKNEQLSLSEKQIKHLNKQIKKEKLKTIGVAIGSGILIILILI